MGYVLVVDDDASIRDVVRMYLENAGFAIKEAPDGVEALRALSQEEPDLVLLDIMMPKLNGYETLKQIRQTSAVPVILLSAKGEDPDKILGLNLGADDYLAKPFNPLELVARVGSHLRRYTQLGGADTTHAQANLTVGDLVLKPDEAVVCAGGNDIALTAQEFKLMQLFMSHPNKVFTKRQIFDHVWEEEGFDVDNSVMVCVSKLRAKLSLEPQRYIQTIRGIGYRLVS
ncbi:MAG: response regulator transcription factor [Atopobiaceae bacterium]|jgi:DNA-binding response OmpR family regulator